MTASDSYRKAAAELRAKAAGARNPHTAEWERLARCYTRLAEQADRNSLQDVWIEDGCGKVIGGD
jgi:hypothetical protein